MAPRCDLRPMRALWISGWPDARGDRGTPAGDRMIIGMALQVIAPGNMIPRAVSRASEPTCSSSSSVVPVLLHVGDPSAMASPPVRPRPLRHDDGRSTVRVERARWATPSSPCHLLCHLGERWATIPLICHPISCRTSFPGSQYAAGSARTPAGPAAWGPTPRHGGGGHATGRRPRTLRTFDTVRGPARCGSARSRRSLRTVPMPTPAVGSPRFLVRDLPPCTRSSSWSSWAWPRPRRPRSCGPSRNASPRTSRATSV